ncbi:MAG: amidohydrolase family protein [Acidimicrobiia bacterium]|nr:amidohydrolase family protein [Acidimicrobiia bacterium]
MGISQTRIHGGSVYVGGDLKRNDILIDGGVVVGMVTPGSDAEAGETIDATGQLVLPGIIDTHAHTRDPGYTHKEDLTTASRAAAVGGVTTMIDMPNVEPPTDTVELFEAKREDAARKSVIDWGHWVAPTKLDQIPKMAAAGATGFKFYQVSGAYPHDPRLAVNDEGSILDIFEAVSDVGVPCLVHPFNQAIFDALSERAWKTGSPHNWDTFSQIYTTDAIWKTAVGVLIELQLMTGVRLQLVHTHSQGSLELIRAAKDRGQRVTAAVDPKYYQLTRSELQNGKGRVCPAGYVTEDPARIEAIWAALNDGTIDMIDSDHAPHTLDEVAAQDNDAWSAGMGSPQYDWLYSIVLSDVAAGRLPLSRAVALLSEEPARLLGLWPRKGSLLPGSDADLVLVDPGARHTLTDEGLQTKVGWTPYLGRTITGVVNLTMLRGTVIARDRQVMEEPGFGQYVAGVAQ